MNLRTPLRSLLPCLLSLWLLVPHLARAAQEAPRTSRYSLVGESEKAPAPEHTSRGVRILGEAGLGGLSALGGGAVGTVVGFGFCQGLGLARSAFLGCTGGALLGGAVGLGVGLPLGVWWGGEALGGDGRLWAALLGAGLGAGLGLPLVSEGGAFMVSPLVLGVAGSVLGYELSQRVVPARVRPLVSVSGRGALLGLSGRF